MTISTLSAEFFLFIYLVPDSVSPVCHRSTGYTPLKYYRSVDDFISCFYSANNLNLKVDMT